MTLMQAEQSIFYFGRLFIVGLKSLLLADNVALPASISEPIAGICKRHDNDIKRIYKTV